MKVGDLVRVRDYCKNGGNLAIVLDTFPSKLAQIQYITPTKEGRMTGMALFSNLEVVNESG